MAVPRKKTSRMKRGNRRSADALTAPAYVEDKQSGNLRRPHHIDLKDGTYSLKVKGGKTREKRQILPPSTDVVT